MLRRRSGSQVGPAQLAAVGQVAEGARPDDVLDLVGLDRAGRGGPQHIDHLAA